jgi:2-methylisocitrate lyase-like PEP mutase family enzyme
MNVGRYHMTLPRSRLIPTRTHSRRSVRQAVTLCDRDAGADNVYVEGLRSAVELKRVGKALRGMPLAMTLMEGGG